MAKSSKQAEKAKPSKVGKASSKERDYGEACFEVEPSKLRVVVDTLIKCSVYGGAKDFGDDGTGTSIDSLLLDVKDGKVNLVYSKLAVYATASVDVKVHKAGSIVVSPSLFTGMKFPGKSLIVTLKKDKVFFESGSMKGDLQVSGSLEDIEAAKPTDKIKCNIIFEKASFEKTVGRVLYNSFDTSLPSYGLPLHIKSENGKVRLVTCDSICVAMLKQKIKSFPDVDTVFPGSALLHIVKSLKSDEVKVGVSDNMFRVVAAGYSIYHPLGVYEMIDVEAYLRDEVGSDDKFEMVCKFDVESFSKAMASALDINKLAKANNIVEVNFAKGTITYRNDVSNVDVSFPVIEHQGSSKCMTDGQKLTAFMSSMKITGQCTMKSFEGRLLIYTEDEKLVYIMPLQ